MPFTQSPLDITFRLWGTGSRHLENWLPLQIGYEQWLERRGNSSFSSIDARKRKSFYRPSPSLITSTSKRDSNRQEESIGLELFWRKRRKKCCIFLSFSVHTPLCCISLGRCCFGLETRVIIAILWILIAFHWDEANLFQKWVIGLVG